MQSILSSNFFKLYGCSSIFSLHLETLVWNIYVQSYFTFFALFSVSDVFLTIRLGVKTTMQVQGNKKTPKPR